jgi:hypothetical protein
MIRLVDLEWRWLFQLFVTAGMKIGDKIIHFCFLQDVCEGWHLTTALKYLCAYLGFAQQTAYSGEVGAFGATIVAYGMALLAATVGKGRRPSAFGRG